jgi:hypothetical protein
MVIKALCPGLFAQNLASNSFVINVTKWVRRRRLHPLFGRRLPPGLGIALSHTQNPYGLPSPLLMAAECHRVVVSNDQCACTSHMDGGSASGPPARVSHYPR